MSRDNRVLRCNFNVEEIPVATTFGATYKNYSLLGSYSSGNCTGGMTLGYVHCNTCCLSELCPGMTEEECWRQKPSELGECIDYCSGTELGGPSRFSTSTSSFCSCLRLHPQTQTGLRMP